MFKKWRCLSGLLSNQSPKSDILICNKNYLNKKTNRNNERQKSDRISRYIGVYKWSHSYLIPSLWARFSSILLFLLRSTRLCWFGRRPFCVLHFHLTELHHCSLVTRKQFNIVYWGSVSFFYNISNTCNRKWEYSNGWWW